MNVRGGQFMSPPDSKRLEVVLSTSRIPRLSIDVHAVRVHKAVCKDSRLPKNSGELGIGAGKKIIWGFPGPPRGPLFPFNCYLLSFQLLANMRMTLRYW